jgi:tetratricopeptide (TPR) repeat protein
MGILVPGSVPISEIVRCSEAAIASNEKGIYHALLGFGHLLLYGEREKLIAPDVDEVMKSFRTALRLSPENGLVQGLAGHSYGYLLRDLERNALMTREAVRLLPGSGPSWSFRAISLAYCGRYDEAVRAASNAVFLSRGTAMQPLTQSTELFARLMAGDVNGAILAGEAALDGIVFRPTIVDLMTAYARAGRIEDGRAKLGLLVQREPNLSLELLKSQDYPIVNPAHRAAVIEAANQLGLA